MKFMAFQPTNADALIKKESSFPELPPFSTLNFDHYESVISFMWCFSATDQMQARTLFFDQAVYAV